MGGRIGDLLAQATGLADTLVSKIPWFLHWKEQFPPKSTFSKRERSFFHWWYPRKKGEVRKVH